MKKLLCLFIGAVVFISTNVSPVMAYDYYIRGKIEYIQIDSRDNSLYYSLIEENANKTTHSFWCYADDTQVPLIMLAYQTQSITYCYTSDPRASSSKRLELITIRRADSITNANIMDTQTEIKNDLKTIRVRYIEYIYIWVYYVYRKLILGY